VDDRADVVLRHRVGDRPGIGDVAGDPGDLGELLLGHPETRTALVGRQIEGDRRYPGAGQQL
jgi:hypothetical protein